MPICSIKKSQIILLMLTNPECAKNIIFIHAYNKTLSTSVVLTSTSIPHFDPQLFFFFFPVIIKLVTNGSVSMAAFPSHTSILSSILCDLCMFSSFFFNGLCNECVWSYLWRTTFCLRRLVKCHIECRLLLAVLYIYCIL